MCGHLARLCEETGVNHALTVPVGHAVDGMCRCVGAVKLASDQGKGKSVKLLWKPAIPPGRLYRSGGAGAGNVMAYREPNRAPNGQMSRGRRERLPFA
jgi:hypothetical protein